MTSIMKLFQTKKNTGEVNLRMVPQVLSGVPESIIKKYEHPLTLALEARKEEEIPLLVNLVNTILTNAGLPKTNASFNKKKPAQKKTEGDSYTIRKSKAKSVIRRGFVRMKQFGKNVDEDFCIKMFSFVEHDDVPNLLKCLSRLMSDFGYFGMKIWSKKIEILQHLLQTPNVYVEKEFIDWLSTKGVNLFKLKQQYDEEVNQRELKRRIEKASLGELISIISQNFKDILEFQKFCEKEQIKMY